MKYQLLARSKPTWLPPNPFKCWSKLRLIYEELEQDQKYEKILYNINFIFTKVFFAMKMKIINEI